RNAPLIAKGKHHDLIKLFVAINERYFSGSINAVITWGKRPTRQALPGEPRKTIKLGSYSGVDRLIRVHPGLDQKWVPRYFVAYIVYHEMLHHVIPGSRGLGRVNLHPPEFKERERQFRHFERAMQWEKRHVARLLRGRRSRRRSAPGHSRTRSHRGRRVRGSQDGRSAADPRGRAHAVAGGGGRRREEGARRESGSCRVASRGNRRQAGPRSFRRAIGRARHRSVDGRRGERSRAGADRRAPRARRSAAVRAARRG